MEMNSTNQPGKSSPSKEIDEMIENAIGWKGKVLLRLRILIRKADPSIIEEVKWKKPSNPIGVPVWSHDGIICVGNVLKNAVRLTFFSGALIKDRKKIFNTRLDSKTVRAIDFHEGDVLDENALKEIIVDAVSINVSKLRNR